MENDQRPKGKGKQPSREGDWGSSAGRERIREDPRFPTEGCRHTPLIGYGCALEKTHRGARLVTYR
jgi:hypothetical protein